MSSLDYPQISQGGFKHAIRLVISAVGNCTAAFLKDKLLPAFVRRPEMVVFSLLILILNAPVVVGSCWYALTFHPEAVRQGQWWRLLTHPFVHLTWYHLLLDGSAFFLLYHSLLEARLLRRLAFVFAAAAGSLAFSWAGPRSADGLCGLSGIAHALMAISAVELVSTQPANSPAWRLGLGAFAFVVGKAAYEALSGRMFFAFLDFGLLGHPIAVSHAGGIIGGLAAVLLCRLAPATQGVNIDERRPVNPGTAGSSRESRFGRPFGT
jgi:rhomboid family GlyGly-CTERM serine protease